MPFLHRRTLTVNRDIEVQLNIASVSPTANAAVAPVVAIVTGRSRNRHMTASENSAVGLANGKTLTTSTR